MAEFAVRPRYVADCSEQSSFRSDQNGSSPNNSLQHYGVKGMKWGVRKDRKNSNTYTRYTTSGKGVYDEFKKSVSPDQWRSFLNSDAAKWLPKPPEGTYDQTKYNSYESYFTSKGAKEFEKKTLSVMKSYNKTFKVDKKVSKEEPRGELIYEDEFQKVYGVGKRLKHYGTKPQPTGNSLSHYGVKGMKWGVRRTPEELGHKPKSSKEDEERSIVEKIVGKPLVKLPHPQVENPKLQEFIDFGVNILQPYMSPGGIVVLGICALIPGFGVGTIAAGQAAYEGYKKAMKEKFNDKSETQK